MSPQHYERVGSPKALLPPDRRNTAKRRLSDCLQISDDDHEDVPITPTGAQDAQPTPSSPPPSFRSRASSLASRRLLSSEDPIATEAERTLNDTFDDGSDSDDEQNNGDDRQRLMRSNTVRSIQDSRTVHDGGRPELPGVATVPPSGATPNSVQVPARPYTNNVPYNSFSQNDGVFANLNAKPERGEKIEEQPPVSISKSII